MQRRGSKRNNRQPRQIDSIRQRALQLFELHGSLGADALASLLSVPRRTAVNLISSLISARKIEPAPNRAGRRQYRISRARYERPPEGRIDIAGPVYARGYRWWAGP